jgi:hypothetical protein
MPRGGSTLKQSLKTDWKGLQTRGEDITGEASVNEIFREI